MTHISLCVYKRSPHCCDYMLFFLLYTRIQEYQQVVDAEWTILYDKLEKIVNSGAKVVLSKLPIGDVATQYFADRSVFM